MAYYVESGQVSTGIVITDWNGMCVSSGGVANKTTVNSYGSMYIFSGGVANKTTVNEDGYLNVSNGGVANSTTVNTWGSMYVYSGGVANKTTVNGGGRIYDGGVANSTIVSSGGSVYICSGGTASETAVKSGGYLCVDSGASALNVVWTPCVGHITVYAGGNVTFASNYSGVYLGSDNTQLSSALAMTGRTLSGHSMYVMNDGVANYTTVDSGGNLYVYSGASALAIKENGGYVVIADGANATFAANSFSGLVITGGYAATLHSGTTASATTLNGGGMIAYDGGMANETTVNRNGRMYVSSGGIANSTTANSFGFIFVSSGGTANSTTLTSYGRLYVDSGAYALDIRESGGFVSIADGANATFAANSFSGLVMTGGYAATLHSGTTANCTTLSGGRMVVYNGGVANDTTVMGRNGFVGVSNGGSVISTVVNSGASMLVLGDAAFTTVNSSARMYISSDGKHTGALTIADGAVVYADEGSIIDFDISTTAPGTAARVNNLSLVQGTPDFTLTVSANQANGVYSLADGAAGFDKTITVNNTAGTNLGTLSVGGELKKGIYTYRLNLVSDHLSLKMSGGDTTPPVAPTVKVSTTALTNKNVTITATFSSDSAKKQYSTDNKTWKTYSKALTVNANGTYYFRGIDEAGNISDVTAYKVANIDKLMPTVKASTTALTNQNVTITATFSKDAAKKQYSTDKKTWKTYSATLTVSANDTWYFRGVDKSGKASTVVTLKVANIDKTAPKTPTVKASTTKATNQNVTVTATFSTDSAKKQYSADNKTWKTYSKALSVAKNGTYYFRGVDAAGNVSKVASIKVANIDKTAPKTPTVKVSTTKATNKSITVTATFSTDSAKKQYSTDKKTWKTYSKALAVKANGTYYFRGVDAAGNASKVASVKVANYVDTANNNWSGATVLRGTVLGALEAKADSVDYYNVGDVAKLMIDMEKGKAKVSFYDQNKKAVKVSELTMANGSVRKNVSALTLAAGNGTTDNFTVAALDDAVKYLKIETADKSLDCYKLAKLA